MVVPGDHVAIALDASLSDVGPILRVVAEILCSSGVDISDVIAVVTPDARSGIAGELPEGMGLEVHHPGHQKRLAYLATTREGRRIYLNRHLTDADVVVPVGRLGYDPILGFRGPWSVIFPSLSDEETVVSHRRQVPDSSPRRPFPPPRLDEPFEVNWLLGTQFQVGVVPGVIGPAQTVAGLAESVRDRGIEALERYWRFESPARAELVLAGIGCPSTAAGIADIVEGLVTASRLVQHGGKIVVLSRAQGSLGPSLQRLVNLDDMKQASAALRGYESDVDSVTARRLAQVLAWADVYLLSGLDPQQVEDLSMTPLDHVEDACRLVSRSHSCLVVSQADLTRAVVLEEVKT
jgi:hypothetical protein